MNDDPSSDLNVLAKIIDQFDLKSLLPVLRACQDLAADESLLDVAVLGQFKCGKSSLLNAILGADVFPVGVLPATTVVTRALAGPTLSVRVTKLNGEVEQVALEKIADYVTEAKNPGNYRQVAVVDVFTPTLQDTPGIRLVDTPGLGSVYAHNTQVTQQWLPNVAVAIVAVSVERPLADEDRRLLDDARQYARRVVVVLTKVDLLSDADLSEVQEFFLRVLGEVYRDDLPLLPFSTRVNTERWIEQFKQTVMKPLLENLAGERKDAFAHKRDHLIRACKGYLEVGLQAAQQADTDRERLRAAVLDESVNEAVIRDELGLAEQRISAEAWPAFEREFFAKQADLGRRVKQTLAAELATWRGNLAEQSGRYRDWMADQLVAELTPFSYDAASLAMGLLEQAEKRFRRVIEAFRDRLSRNVHNVTGVAISPVAWEMKRPHIAVIPVSIGQTFMTNWELLWWMLPMRLVGGLFRRHALRRVPWEVEKNLFRLVADWTEAVVRAMADLRTQAETWANAELSTLNGLLQQQPQKITSLQEAMHLLTETGLPHAAYVPVKLA